MGWEATLRGNAGTGYAVKEIECWGREVDWRFAWRGLRPGACRDGFFGSGWGSRTEVVGGAGMKGVSLPVNSIKQILIYVGLKALVGGRCSRAPR